MYRYMDGKRKTQKLFENLDTPKHTLPLFGLKTVLKSSGRST
jgi:hypothetical protein